MTDDLPDVDIDELLNETDRDRINPDTMTRGELFEYVQKRGSVPLDDEGRVLINCACLSVRYSSFICGIYPMPDPSGQGMISVCTGPLIEKDTKFDTEYKDGEPPHPDCPYSPDRLNE